MSEITKVYQFPNDDMEVRIMAGEDASFGGVPDDYPMLHFTVKVTDGKAEFSDFRTEHPLMTPEKLTYMCNLLNLMCRDADIEDIDDHFYLRCRDSVVRKALLMKKSDDDWEIMRRGFIDGAIAVLCQPDEDENMTVTGHWQCVAILEHDGYKKQAAMSSWFLSRIVSFILGKEQNENG